MSIKEKTTDPGEALRDRGVLAWRKLASENPADVILATCDWWDSADLGVGALVAAIRDGGMKAVPRDDSANAKTRHLRLRSTWEPLLGDLPEYPDSWKLRAISELEADNHRVTVEAVRAKLGPSPLDEAA